MKFMWKSHVKDFFKWKQLFMKNTIHMLNKRVCDKVFFKNAIFSPKSIEPVDILIGIENSAKFLMERQTTDWPMLTGVNIMCAHLKTLDLLLWKVTKYKYFYGTQSELLYQYYIILSYRKLDHEFFFTNLKPHIYVNILPHINGPAHLLPWKWFTTKFFSKT